MKYLIDYKGHSHFIRHTFNSPSQYRLTYLKMSANGVPPEN